VRPPELFEPPLPDALEPEPLPLLALVRLSLGVLRLSLSPEPPLSCWPEPPFSLPSSRIFGVTTTRPLDALEWLSAFDVPSLTRGTTRVDFVGTGGTVNVALTAELVSVDCVEASPTSAGRVVTTVGI
jgi:hypothetical protein